MHVLSFIVSIMKKRLKTHKDWKTNFFLEELNFVFKQTVMLNDYIVNILAKQNP